MTYFVVNYTCREQTLKFTCLIKHVYLISKNQLKSCTKKCLFMGYSTTAWTEFCHFWTPLLRGQFLYTERRQKQTFLTPSLPNLVHVVIEWHNEKTIWYFQSKSEVCRQSDVCLMTILWLWSLNRGIETGFCTGAHLHFHTEIKYFHNWNRNVLQSFKGPKKMF